MKSKAREAVNMEDIAIPILATMKPGSCEWDINCGLCEEWAESAICVYGGTLFWLDSVLHCVVKLGGLYYDSQNPRGKRFVKDLDVVRGVSRAEFLKSKHQG